MICKQCGERLLRSEFFVVRSNAVVEVKCCKCKGLADVWVEVRESHAQASAPTVVHRNAQGATTATRRGYIYYTPALRVA